MNPMVSKKSNFIWRVVARHCRFWKQKVLSFDDIEVRRKIRRDAAMYQNVTSNFMKQVGLSILFLLTTLPSVKSQNNDKSPETFCEKDWCRLPKDHEAHFDPYYNGHLCENFDPKQTDFSKEYFTLRTRHTTENVVHDLAGFDLSAIWLTLDDHQNGVIGLDCKRIRVFIGKVTKDPKDKLLYHVEGKSNVNGNICDFKGDIKILNAYEIPADSESEHENSGRLLAEYTFYEDKTQKSVGSFKGIHECFYYLDNKSKKGFIDESFAVADGYFNRSFVGTWTSYNTKAIKKCIWGDYRLPFTFDFDCGDGEMKVCDKYVQNGWTTYNSQEEYDIVGAKAVLKDKWWTK